MRRQKKGKQKGGTRERKESRRNIPNLSVQECLAALALSPSQPVAENKIQASVLSAPGVSVAKPDYTSISHHMGFAYMSC